MESRQWRLMEKKVSVIVRKMCKVQMLRALVKQRLTAAAEEIFVLFERAITEYEEELSRSKEENERQQKLLDAVFNPQLQLHRADVQQLLVVKEEVPPEQQEWSPSLDQEDPEPPHIIEEQEELWTSQEGEQLRGWEEADVKFPFTPVHVKSEDDEEKPQSSQLHQRQTAQMETESDGEHCGIQEPAWNSDPNRHPEPDTVDTSGDFYEPEPESSNDWKERGEPQSGWKSLNNEEVCVSDSRCSTGEKRFSCSECGKRFGIKRDLKIHMRSHTGEKPFRCSVCMKSFTQSAHLQLHTRIHTGEKPFCCSVCMKSFTQSGHFQVHMRIHTGEKLFSCFVCNKAFSHSGHLKIHMRSHTGEKPFICSVCKKSFTQSAHLQLHMRIHTGEKPFCCSICKKSFTLRGNLQRHMIIHTGEKPFRASNQHVNEQMDREADGEDCGGPEPARISDPDRHPEPNTVDKTGSSSEPETDDSNDWKETRELQSGLNSLDNYEVPVSDSICGTDVQQMLVVKEEVPPEQQEWSPCLDQEDPEPPYIKEEQEELWTSQEGEQLQGLEEADIKFPFTPVPIKSEDDEEKPQSPQFHRRQTEQIETEADGQHCRGPEPARNSDPDTHLQPDTVDQTGDSSEHETDDSDVDWEETREPQSSLNSLTNYEITVSDSRCNAGEKPFICSECGKRYSNKVNLKRHMRFHTGEKLFSCSVCGKAFVDSGLLKTHIRSHTGEKPFSCTVCNKSFTQRGNLQKHIKVHTGEKPFNCLVCGKAFIQSGDLKIHMRFHTGEKPFSCSVCKKSFAQRGNLQKHMRVHTGEKPFSCSVCDKSFIHNGNLKTHMRSHTGEKPFSCSVCKRPFTQRGNLQSHMRVHSGEKPLRASSQQLD